MTKTTYIDPLQSFLSQKYPQPNALWNASDNNRLDPDWLHATPTDVWGSAYSAFTQAVAGNGALGLAPCSSASGPTERCVAMDASVTTPGEAAEHLLAGHSDRLTDALYDLMVSADVLLDFTTLTPPTGRFLDAFRNAIAYLSNKPAGSRPIVRILFSNPLPDIPPLKARPFLEDITDQLDPHCGLEIYVYVMSSSVASWNHAKIVAADGARALVGGHNMWGPHYLGPNPVFDVSMRVTGDAARHAHDFADKLWAYGRWYDAHPLRTTGVQRQFDLECAYRPDASGAGVIVPGVLPAPTMYPAAVARFPASDPTPGAPVLAVGRGGNIGSTALLPTLGSYLLPFTEPSDEVLVQLVSLAQRNVRLSVQSFQLAGGLVAGWNHELFLELGRALDRGVTVDIVLSNPKALAGGLGALEAPYDGEAPATINEKVLRTLMADRNKSEADAKRILASGLRVASFRYSADATYPIQPSIPKAVPIPNHAKTLMVDDAAFYIGSQNMYASNLSEFGYIVEDPTAAATYISQYWTPLWRASQVTVSPTYDDDLDVDEQLEAVQFILALPQDTRMAVVWHDLLTQLEAAPDADARATLELKMEDLVATSGFVTTLVTVLEGLKTPFFSQTPPATEASPEALRFVTNLMSSPDLMAEFAKVVEAPAKTVAEADRAIADFLKTKGYSCNALEVLAAFATMQRKVLVYWSGSYATAVTDDGGAAYSLPTRGNRRRAAVAQASAAAPVDGPALVVTGDEKVLLDGTELVDTTFDANTLTWDRSAGNATSGSLRFGTVTRPGITDAFQGSECFGTITYPDDGSLSRQGVWSLYGRRSPVVPPNPGSDDVKGFTVLTVLGILALAATTSALVYLTYKLVSRQLDHLRRARENRARDDDYIPMDELANVSSRGRVEEVRLINGGLLRKRLQTEDRMLEELAPFQSRMSVSDRTVLSRSRNRLRDALDTVDDSSTADLGSVLTTQGQVADRVHTDLDDVMSNARSFLDRTTATSVRESSKLSTEIRDRMDAYEEDRENGLPIEEDEL